MKIAIVGCGRNSRYHIESAKAYAGGTLVAVVDSDRQKARAAAEAFGIPASYGTLNELLDRTSVNVVHIVTPPQTHATLARKALNAKSAVLIETPFALNRRDAAALYELAAEKDVLLGPVYNHLYDPCMTRAREIAAQGHAGEIVNVESYYSVNAEAPGFREYPAPNVLPWVYSLPGGVYQNFLAHPLSVLLPFTGKPREVKVMKASRGVLLRGMPDEVRILVQGERALGSFTLSFAAKPQMHFLRLYGTKMMIEADFNTMTTITHPATLLPRPLQKAFYSLSESAHRLGQTAVNAVEFARGRLKPQPGLKNLIHAFYDAVTKNRELPVSRDEALLVTEVTDEIPAQVRQPRLSFAPIIPPAARREPRRKRVLLTEGTGFLERRIAPALLRAGYAVRVLARKLSNVDSLKGQDVEIYFGDAADKTSLTRAFEGVDIVVHAAATGRTGQVSLQGTRNVLDLCARAQVDKLVYLGSCEVYGTAEYRSGQQVTETSTLERFPLKRGPAVAVKLDGERLVRWAMEQGRIPVVVLRTGLVYGPGRTPVTPAVGLSLANKALIFPGPGDSLLPVVYVDNAASAVVRAVQSERANNQIFNVVDSEAVTRKEYVRQVIRKKYPRMTVFSCPQIIIHALTLLGELAAKAFKRRPIMTGYALVAAQRSVQIDGAKLTETLHWSPPVRFEQAVAAIADARTAKTTAAHENEQADSRLDSELQSDVLSGRG